MGISSGLLSSATLGGPSAANFSPASLSLTAWWDPSDLTTVFKADGTTAVSADGDAVGKVLDKSGNGNHFVQVNGAPFNPTWKTSGGLSWIDFDGSFNWLTTPISLGSANTMSAYFAMQPGGSETTWITAYGLDGGGKYFGYATAAGGNSYASAGTPAYRVNGAAVGGTNQNLLTAMPVSTSAVMTAENLDLTGWSNFLILGYNGFQFAGKFYGAVLVPDLSSPNRASIETWLGAKAGIVI